MKQAKNLLKQAKQHYPHSKNMKHQWVRKTIHLINTGKHVLLGGNVKWEAS